jgi:hypothetical protein
MNILRSLYAAAAVLLAFSATARATAIFDASSSATLSITGIENVTDPGSFLGLNVSGQSEVLTDAALFIGNAFASTDSGADVTGTDPLLGLQHLAAVEGTASGIGNAEAAVFNEGSIGFENTSLTDSFLITLVLDYALIVSAAVDDTSNENAFSNAFVKLFSDSLTIDFFSLIRADALLEPPSDDDSAQLAFELLVGPGESDTVFLSASADGFADSLLQVPEPSTLSSTALLVAAFLVLELRRRRRP